MAKMCIRDSYKAYKKSKDINIRMEKNFAPCDALHRFGLYMGTSAITILTALMALHGTMELPMALMLIVYSYVMFNTIEAANNSPVSYTHLDVYKRQVKKGAVMEEKITEIFINGKNTVAMSNIDQFKRHIGSAFHGIFVTTSAVSYTHLY